MPICRFASLIANITELTMQWIFLRLYVHTLLAVESAAYFNIDNVSPVAKRVCISVEHLVSKLFCTYVYSLQILYFTVPSCTLEFGFNSKYWASLLYINGQASP